ncbi:endonuclease G, mitochondrial-like [Tubulanus polymorphus]|uniref:endonuclease G, mitochondrial-like n=1 Tax=Tubulanus polymorphus TaxID=672921 RepID=UPI003DA3EC7E
MIMSRIRNISIIASLGVGAWIGREYEKTRSNSNNTPNTPMNSSSNLINNRQSESIFTSIIPIVSAARNVPAVPMDYSVTPSAPAPSKLPNKNLTEITRFGFPGFDNIRSRDDYVISYDRRNRIPRWVLEHLNPQKIQNQNSSVVDREKSEFKEDQTILPMFRSSNSDYRRSGYDRGHMAAAGNHRINQHSCDETFILSNIAPQVGNGFNRHAWNDLERYVRHLTRQNKNIYICTGPLFLPRREKDGKVYVKYEVIGQNNVAVPTHFFKVIVMETNSGTYSISSFVLPNEVLPEKVNLLNYLVPLDSIERAAGLVFFDKLPKNIFTNINGQRNNQS